MTDPWGFSVVILTLNEERNLPGCLAALRGCDDIVVLDSGSTDRTVELARAAGARVITHPFRDFASQRNHAHAAAAFRHDWVFHLDADEVLTPELITQCRASAVRSDPAIDGYYAAPRMMFAGRWLRHCTDYPAWQARFVHWRRFHFIEVGHGQREAPGMRMGHLAGDYLHDITVTDLAEWERKHRRYARAEAQAYLEQSRAAGSALTALLRGPTLARRRAVKLLSHRLPLRPLLRFLYQYGLRRGFLDGPSAYRYCRLLARYEGFVDEAIRAARTTAP